MAARVSLDEIDHQLLGLLQEDAARTLFDLGRAVRLSPSAVQRRIGRYLSSGLIARRTAVLDPRALGEVLLAVVLVQLTSGAAEFTRLSDGVFWARRRSSSATTSRAAGTTSSS